MPRSAVGCSIFIGQPQVQISCDGEVLGTM